MSWPKGLERTPNNIAKVGFAKRRNGILAELQQMKNDCDSWNDAHPNEKPLVIGADFTKDIERLLGERATGK